MKNEKPLREYDFSMGKRGPLVQVPKGKTRITIRLDDDILDWFRQQAHGTGGGNYQTMINKALREYIESETSSFEQTLRQVIREELAR
ncbi:BrnA antitoxin family protein [Acidobacteriota bacterium]